MTRAALGRVLVHSVPTSSGKVMNKGWMERVFGNIVIVIF
jgi:hypothetical protein